MTRKTVRLATAIALTVVVSAAGLPSRAASPTEPGGAAADATDAAEAEQVRAILARVRGHDFHPIEGGFTNDRVIGKHGVADLRDDDWKVRLLAIRDLTRLGGGASGALIGAFDDENPHVRHVAVYVVGLLRDERAEPAVRRVLMEDSDEVVRSQAAISLGWIGLPGSLDALRDRLKGDPSRDVRHQCELAAYRIDRRIEHTVDLAAAYAELDERDFERAVVGEPAPDFRLTDTTGKVWKLSDFRGSKTVVLVWVFADWCPVCHGEFQDLIQMREKFRDADVEVVTIECHDPYRASVMMGGQGVRPDYWFAKDRPVLDLYAERAWWRHLVDPAGGIAARYGAQPLAFTVHSEWINRPATVIVDQEGVIRFAYYGTFWGDRPSIEETLELIQSGEYEYENPRRLKR